MMSHLRKFTDKYKYVIKVRQIIEDLYCRGYKIKFLDMSKEQLRGACSISSKIIFLDPIMGNSAHILIHEYTHAITHKRPFAPVYDYDTYFNFYLEDEINARKKEQEFIDNHPHLDHIYKIVPEVPLDHYEKTFKQYYKEQHGGDLILKYPDLRNNYLVQLSQLDILYEEMLA